MKPFFVEYVFPGAPSSMGSEGDEEVPVFKKMDDAEDNGDDQEEAMAVSGGMEESAPAEDLFSEIHLGQLKRLEKQLESSETEKQKLCVNAKEVQESLEAALREVSTQRARVAELLAYCAHLDKLTTDEDLQLTTKGASNVKVG
jgi:Microtubule-associated protein Bicaudal-D